MTAERKRPHTGRQRNEAARTAILDAAMALLGTARFTADEIAREAGVGKQTLYRWWPSKAAVVAEAMGRRARDIAPVPDTGTVLGDLREFLAGTFTGAAEPANRNALRQIMASAQQDEHLAEAVAGFTAARRDALRSLLERAGRRGELPAGADLDLAVDQAYGVLWYRLLVGHAPLDRRAAEQLARALIASVGA